MLLLVAFAGCSEAPADADEDFSEELDERLEATDTTGVIRGIVLDPTVNPVADVTVSVVNSDRTTQTDAQGLFGFDALEPGTYFLEVSKSGFNQVQASVDVAADVDRPPLVKIQITADELQQPYHAIVQWDGFLGCSVRLPDRGQSCPAATTLYPEHDFLVDIALDMTPTWVTSEMSWESTQSLGGEMSFNLRRPDTNTDTKDIEGRSPLAITLNETEIAPDGDERGGFGPDVDLRVIVFTAHLQETEPPCLPTGACYWGIGLQLDQSFSTFTTVFYNYAPPEDWRFLETGQVPKP